MKLWLDLSPTSGLIRTQPTTVGLDYDTDHNHKTAAYTAYQVASCAAEMRKGQHVLRARVHPGDQHPHAVMAANRTPYFPIRMYGVCRAKVRDPGRSYFLSAVSVRPCRGVMETTM